MDDKKFSISGLKNRLNWLYRSDIIPFEYLKEALHKLNRGNSELAESILTDLKFNEYYEKKYLNERLDVISSKISYKSDIDAGSDREKDIDKITQYQTELFAINQECTSLKKALESADKRLIRIANDKNTLEQKYLELQMKSQQKRIDEKIPDYVKDVSDKLNIADKYFSNMANIWSGIGIIMALLAVAASFWTFSIGSILLKDNQVTGYTAILYVFIRGGLGIALLSWIALISFSNARNYTHESILRKDRQHALTFGRLFLQIFGASAEKNDAITVFKDWNMSGKTAFSGKSYTPPNPLAYLSSLKRNENKDKKPSDNDE